MIPPPRVVRSAALGLYSGVSRESGNPQRATVTTMLHVTPLYRLGLAVAVLNLPFGYWRAGTRRFTRPWFFAVHTPVPVVIALRILAGIAWKLASLPVLMGAFVLGQFLGGRVRLLVKRSQ